MFRKEGFVALGFMRMDGFFAHFFIRGLAED